MEFRILKKAVPCLLVVSLLFGNMAEAVVLAADTEEYPIIYGDLSESEFPVAVLTSDETEYTVLPGDSLWKIAEKLWGNGKGYVDLAQANKDLIKDPDVILPGMVLAVSKTGGIVRKEAKYGGIQMVNYSMDMPYGWTTGIMDSGDAFANFVMSGDGGVIACLVQDKKKETGASVKDWEQCTEKIAAYVNENYGKQVSDLCFEHYRMEDQGDASGEIYLYSFTWQVSADYPNLKHKACVGLKLTDHIQAEFVGFGTNYDIHGGVRYVTAAFEEHYDPDSSGKFTVNDSNMQIVPETEWELGGMFNSFAWIDEFFTSILKEVLGAEKEKSTREKLMEKMQH